MIRCALQFYPNFYILTDTKAQTQRTIEGSNDNERTYKQSA